MDLKTLREKRAKLIADARAILDRADKETRDLTGEEVASQRQMLDAAKALAGQIRNTEDLEADERITLPETQRPETTEALAQADAQETEVRTFLREAVRGRGPLELSLKATPADLRAMDQRKRTIEQRGQNTLAGASGGFAVSPDVSMYGQIVETLLEFGGMDAFGATVLMTGTGADLPMATVDDTANTGSVVAEEASRAAGTDITLGQKTMKAFRVDSKILKFSEELEQDPSFPLVPFISRQLGIRLGRKKNSLLTTGLGVGEPQGVSTAATVGRQGATGFSTTVDFAELKRAKHSVDIAYRTGARWMFSDDTALAISLVVDGNGRFLLTDNVREGDPQFLLGHPVVINNDMADMAASAKSILFGRGSGYYIRQVQEIRIAVLRELYAENGQIGIFAYLRLDGGLIETSAIKAWQNSAT